MINRYFENIINRYGVWCTIKVALAGLSAILLAMAVFQFFVPVHTEQTEDQTSNVFEFTPNEVVSMLLDENKDKTREAITYRPGMFKPATGLQDKPLAEKTIERIKEQLKLQCVMEMNGQPVAYITIRGVGLKKCCIGEGVNDLFTVLDINKKNKSVDISIVGHKTTLQL